MISALMERRLVAAERETGEGLDFVRDILRGSKAGFLKFLAFLPLAQHRAAMPADAYFVARLTAVRHEDCGPCVQTVIRYARKAGVDAGVLRAVVEGRAAALPPDLAEIHRFAQAVVSCDPACAEQSEALRRRYGDAAMVDLAFGIATGRVFPTVKRVLGHGQSCAATGFDY
jgi:alkylhydroperoxidase family enzyme